MVGLDARLGRVIGKRTADRLAASFDMTTVRDLLTHYPRRLDDRGALTDISKLRVDEHATVLARVVGVRATPYVARSTRRRSTRTEVRLTDGRVEVTATFFNQPWRAGHLKPGTVAFFSGKVGVFRGKLQLTQPAYDVLGFGAEPEPDEQRRFWPIYPATSRVSSAVLMRSVKAVLDVLDPLPDHLPGWVREEHGLLPYDAALRLVHTAEGPEDFARARERLRFDEAFVLQTALVQRRRAAREQAARARRTHDDRLLARFDAALPFTLTAAQREVGEEIAADLAREAPMQRLLQGEVGSGKTLVALRAILQVIDAGGQAALLAPTEVLAQQHYRAVLAMLGPLGEGGMLTGAADGTRVLLLTGSTPAARRREVLADLASGSAGLVIGTHALLEESVRYADLGLVVVDEQHRFGVEQRAALTERPDATPPHVLVMTATPIPRTVAMTVFGDLDVSTMAELPPGRSPVTTVVAPADRPRWVARVWERVREEVDTGRQAYVVCPRIGGDEPDDAPDDEPSADDEGFQPRRAPLAVLDVASSLADGPLAGLRLAVLHGRLLPDQKDFVMRAFAAGDIDVLVSTTVIEVGVDVPNATVMVVLDADRFGVSSLHQLRGRIGRGTGPGVCLLVTEAPEGSDSRARVEAVAATADGFAIAELDLRNRREGDILGAAQSGTRSSLKLLSVLRDGDVIGNARAAAEWVVEADPTLAGHPLLALATRRMFSDEQAGFLERT